jgi:hypothetical protein
MDGAGFCAMPCSSMLKAGFVLIYYYLADLLIMAFWPNRDFLVSVMSRIKSFEKSYLSILAMLPFWINRLN